MAIFPEQVALVALMAGWVITLPPGSLYFQAMCRLLLVLVLIVPVALVLGSPDFFRLAGQTVTVGAFAGIAMRLLFLRRHPGHSFSAAMLPRVMDCEIFFTAVMQGWIGEVSADAGNASLEVLWQELPQWVHSGGFDRRLQPGYQFFMRRLSDVGDVLFSLHYLSRNTEGSPSADFLRIEFGECVSAIQRLFAELMAALRFETGHDGVSDFSDHLVALEKKIRRNIPAGMEWHESHRGWIRLADVVCCLEDLRWLLLKLNETLNPPVAPLVALKRPH